MSKTGENIEPGADVLDEEALIKAIKADLEYAYGKAKPFLEIATQLKLEHDNELDPDAMPTRSKMSIPYKFAQTEEALGKSHEYLWPPMNIVEAIPDTEEIPMERVRNVERGLYHMARDRMNCPVESLPIERDCYKIGFGYGIIEPCKYDRLEAVNKAVVSESGETTASSIEMGISAPISSLRMRYISGGQIISYPF